MSTARELAAAVEARPDDPMAWLVYADFLAELESPLEGLFRQKADRLRTLAEYPNEAVSNAKAGQALEHNHSAHTDALRRTRPEAINTDDDVQSDPGYRWLLWQLAGKSNSPNVYERMNHLAEVCRSTGDHRPVVACVSKVLRARGERIDADEWYWRLVELCQRFADGHRASVAEIDAVNTMLDEAIETDDIESEIRQQREPSRRYATNFDFGNQPFTEGTEVLSAIRSHDPSQELLNTGFDLLGSEDQYEKAFDELEVRNPFPVPGDR